jgi:hypothetical protein
MNISIIYALIREFGEIYYVGRSLNPTRRMREHKKTLGFKPQYIVLEQCGDNWREAERRWIAHYFEVGAPLINKLSGGNGLPMMSESGRRAVSERQIGRPLTDSHRAAISEGNKGVARNWTPAGEIEVRKNQFKAGQSSLCRMTPEQTAKRNAKLSVAIAGLSSEERSRRNRKAWASMTPEQRAARGERIRQGQIAGISSAKRAEIAAMGVAAQKRRIDAMTPEALAEYHARRGAALSAALARKKLASK